ncbi:hypothetical protein JCM21531_1968 [Acetivibrio straminisolvens JCM 21531]|uniref:SAM-dependent methyltransferase n=2 Tax=Acetivibrio straminisolvens TaxID=253314 RepID=W4V521_9FIRM|nr:hypothetical protein JCM21531_1968 [Acetivibrio straminisolvens JCM 21531]
MRRETEFKGLDLPEIVFIGRTYDEYKAMFDLTDDVVKNNAILDVPAGSCSFAAISNSMGGKVTVADVAYYHPAEKLYEKGLTDISQIVSSLSKVKEQYVWNYFKDEDSLEKARRQTLYDCVTDMKSNPHVYVPCILPKLPFEDEQFDITLSAHFLFTYSDRLSLSFHKETIKELLRVTKKEVRIFPLIDLKSKRYSEMDAILEFIQSCGWQAEERAVHYEFQRNANSMLRIYKVCYGNMVI